jgi:hypothetical protein
MFDFFEQPYTLIGVAVLVLFGILTFRSMLPEKRHWWQWLVPALLAAAAFGLDSLVRTDLEKINAIISTGIKAVEEEDCDAIETIIADNYSDSYHGSKTNMLAHCRRTLSKHVIEKNKKTSQLIEISEPDATAILFLTIIFDKDSSISKDYYKPFIWMKAKLYLQKQPDKEWLISRVEVLEIDRQPVNWNQIR